jgi:ribosomal protein S18 acetylase RimI-like enzyme
LAVSPNWRREGLAKLLIKNALKSFPSCSLRVNTSNKAAIQLYKSCGFNIEKKEEHFYGENEHAFFMSN